MGQIQIIRKASDLPAGSFSLCGFSDAKGNRLIAQPVESEGNILWTVPDTDENRSIFRRDFSPGGFLAKTIDERQASAMDADERDVLVTKIASLESELGSAKTAFKESCEDADALRQSVSALTEERDSLAALLDEAKAEIELLKTPAETGDADAAKSTSKASAKKIA